MSLAELLEKIHELSPEEQTILRRELDGLQEPDFEAPPEMLAAIEEGRRSLREEGGIPIEDVMKEVESWNTKSS